MDGSYIIGVPRNRVLEETNRWLIYSMREEIDLRDTCARILFELFERHDLRLIPAITAFAQDSVR